MICQEPGCWAEITFAINLKSLKRVPLVPYNPEYPKSVRYRMSGTRADGQRECERDDAGDWMNHNANCPGAGKYTRGRR